MKIRLEVFLWDDASSAWGPDEPEDIKTHFLILTSGQFVKEDRDTLTVAGDVYQGKDERRVRHYATVHKSNIVTRKTLWTQVSEKAGQQMKHGKHIKGMPKGMLKPKVKGPQSSGKKGKGKKRR